MTKQQLATDKAARPVRWIDPPLENNDHVLRGNIGFLKLQEGLSVHYSNAEDLHDLKIETECGPRLNVAVFLEGAVEAWIGPFRIPMPTLNAAEQRWDPIATIYAQTQSEKFIRYARRGVCLKKVTISITHAWLNKFAGIGGAEFSNVLSFTKAHLANRTWRPSAHAVGLAEQIVNTRMESDLLSSLYIESRVIGLVEEGFRQLCQPELSQYPGHLRPQDRQRMQSVEEYLNAHSGRLVTGDELAVGVGLSPNTLHRLLTNAVGLSTSRYIRWYMLEKARTALERDKVTIAEAAYIAGYSSQANFTTAFKRCFGMTPSALQER
ncbi:AraC family transcriptional regulator [uncultured Roseibium sp.]|uniref:AraC family transcriptional regulator n=1 Tax=uncultured Roseibium sp. TaxID=1936171 RepID=UPI0032175F40